MKASDLKVLKDLERNSTDEAVKRLMNGDVYGSQQAFERAELAKGLQTHLQQGRAIQWVIPVVVALICGTVASVLAVYRIPSVHLTANIRSTTASFTPRDTLTWKGNHRLAPDAFRFEKFHAALAPLEAGEAPGPDTSRGLLDLKRGQAALKSVSFEEGSRVAVEVDRSGYTRWFSSRGQAEAQVLFWKRVGIELEADGEVQAETLNVEVPETLYLTRTDRGVVPSLIELDPKTPFELPLIEVESIGFSKEIIEDGGARFDSSIIEGEVSILDVDDRASVGPNQSLTLIGFSGQIRRMTVGKEIRLGLTGTAQDIVISSGNIERSLVPTYLAFMYRNQQIALVWSGVAFLWGMLWSVGRFITRR